MLIDKRLTAIQQHCRRPPEQKVAGGLKRARIANSVLHANQSVTDGYSKLKDDVTFRKKVAEQRGLTSSFRVQIVILHPIEPKVSCYQLQRKDLKLKRKNGSTVCTICEPFDLSSVSFRKHRSRAT
jgi:hypothetical protein